MNKNQSNDKKSSNQQPSDLKMLSQDVLNIYQKNIEIVESLAQRYSFKALYYWQPTVFGKSPLTKYEKMKKQERIDLLPIYEMTSELLDQTDFTMKGEIEFQGLRSIFKGVKEP